MHRVHRGRFWVFDTEQQRRSGGDLQLPCTGDGSVCSGIELTADYTYTDDNLTGLETYTTAYTLSYGSFSLLDSVDIGNRNLASYSYTDDGTNRLSSLSYGNGDHVDYEYDKRGRVLGKTWEDGFGLRYFYDNDGALAKTVDSATGRTVTYTYDPTDRLVRRAEVGNDYDCTVSYEYSAQGMVLCVRYDTLSRRLGLTKTNNLII